MAVVSKIFPSNYVLFAVVIATALGVANDALAQQPSQAQLNALRSSCRGDYMAHCSSVPTGGAPALNCLKQHMSALSSGCQSAVNGISPAAPVPAAAPVAPTPAAVPPPAPSPTIQAAPAAPRTAAPGTAAMRKPSQPQRQAEAATIRRACNADYRVHCAGISPGGSASIACLKRNVKTLSNPCLRALAGATTVAAAPSASSARAAAPVQVSAPPPAEPAPLLVSRREEMLLLRNACGADYAVYCRGLRRGLGRIAACLHYNRGNLSPRCQQALIALHEGR
jgi:hypothetical protein